MKIFRLVVLAAALLMTGGALAQNITNTMGAGGAFVIKDASNDYFMLNQSNGNSYFWRNIELGNQQNSSSTVGVITKGNAPFIHTFKSTLATGNNTFVGVYAGNVSMDAAVASEASNNTGMGYQALNSLTSGYQNSAFGAQSLNSNSTGNSNSAFGYESLFNNASGIGNCAFGFGSMGSASFTGNYNVAIGRLSGNTITSGSNLIVIGNTAQPSSGTASNEVTLGNSSVTVLRCNAASITALSDARDKAEIRDLTLGLDFLMKVRPRLFNWDRRDWYADKKSDGSKRQAEPTAGFIAQELDALQMGEGAEYLKLVLKENPEKLEATSGNLFPVLVKAVQDLKKEKDAEIASLTKENADLKMISLAQQREIETLKTLASKVASLEQSIARIKTATNELTELK